MAICYGVAMSITFAEQLSDEQVDDSPSIAAPFAVSASGVAQYLAIDASNDEVFALAEDNSDVETLLLEAGQTSFRDRVINLANEGQGNKAVEFLQTALQSADLSNEAKAEFFYELADYVQEAAPDLDVQSILGVDLDASPTNEPAFDLEEERRLKAELYARPSTPFAA